MTNMNPRKRLSEHETFGNMRYFPKMTNLIRAHVFHAKQSTNIYVIINDSKY